jgi:hypothetical protein
VPAQERAGAADLLTRTTLQMDENLSPRTIGQIISALQRVPGVLLAEIGPGTARAIVAHDAAVPSASLLEAAARIGVRLKFVADTRVPAAIVGTLQPPAGVPIQRLLMLAAAFAFLPILIAAISPRLGSNPLLLPILLSSMWAFVIARAIFRRRP